ncbi:MAG TPA: ABC transporter permease [Gemmatimonadaceae bacterium]
MSHDDPARRWRLLRRSSRRIREDVDDELAFHREMRERELVAAGLPAEAARRRALEEFGDIAALREACAAEDVRGERDERRADWLADLRQDLAHAARAALRAPGFTAIVVLTLALGIGLNAAIFGVVHRILVAPLPYADAEGLVRIYGRHLDRADERGQLSAADVVDFREAQRSFASIGVFRYAGGTLAGDAEARRLDGAGISPNLLSVLGVRPALGRDFREGEGVQGGQRVALVTDALWRSAFGGDSAAIGRTMLLNEQPHTIVGVLPPGFRWPAWEASFLVPLDLGAALADANRARKFHFLGAFARLRPGVDAARAEADLAAIARELERRHPEANEGMGVRVLPLRESIAGEARRALLLVGAAAALVLLVACANVAGLLLARGVTRQRELAVRAALGAGRGRLARQLLAESVFLAAIGGAVAALLASPGAAALARLGAPVLPESIPAEPGPAVFALAAAVTLASVVVFGLAPAMIGARGAVSGLREGPRGATEGAGRSGVRRALVVGQMALAVVLLIGAGLLGRSLLELRRVALGFDPTRLFTFDVVLAAQRYATSAAQDAFFEELLGRLRALPGVVDVGSGAALPLAGGSSASLVIDGIPHESSAPPEVGYTPVSDDYFRALRIPLLRGRAFDARDHEDATGVVIVNESAARLHWGDADPVGARVRLGPDPSQPWSVVVGVVGDVRNQAPDAEPRPTAYVSSRQDHWGFARIVVRTSGDPTESIGAVRHELRRLDPMVPLGDAQTMEDRLSDALAGRRLPLVMLGGFAALALVLAALGIYGVTAYAVAARTREFGVRLALGARPGGLLAMVVGEGTRSALLGLAIGIALSAAGARVLGRLLYGVGTLDWPTYAGAAAVLLTAALLACWVPARRATRVDPADALRLE